jgi:tRNA wybutosine-synthesizing protein 2
VERVREKVSATLGARISEQLPDGYQRLGRVLVVRLPETIREHFRAIGEAYRSELDVGAVLRRAGETQGELRIPHFELIAGEDSRTEVVEYGIRYRLDAQRVLFARGNRAERHRAGTLTRPGEVVADLFAGIGYFCLPVAVHGRAAQVWAIEKNPVSFEYLLENVRRNHVGGRVTCIRGDNREANLPLRTFDRVFLGYLPSSVPWISRALDLLRASGGSVHVHLVVGRRDGYSTAEAEVAAASERAGGRVEALQSRVVKPYGPGREHVVVDLTARPGTRAP